MSWLKTEFPDRGSASSPSPWSSARRSDMDYVSCSPYRVPIARLAAAQAAITKNEASSEANRTE